jgi:hypothetical protein
MSNLTVWNGRVAELRELRTAIEDNCTCAKQADAKPGNTCSAHSLMTDQRVMDHLAFAARYRWKWQLQEDTRQD